MEALYQLSYSPRAAQGTSDVRESSARRPGARPVRSPPMTERPLPPPSDAPQHRYNARLANEIEAKWQDRWERDHTFWTPNPTGPLSDGFEAAGRHAEALRARHVPVPER